MSGNSAAYGGGTASCTANNCLLTGNTAAQIGGGAVDGTLNNCTVVNNLALVSGGGAYVATNANLNNSIIYNNSAPAGNQPASKRLDKLLISTRAHKGTASTLAGVLTGDTILK